MMQILLYIVIGFFALALLGFLLPKTPTVEPRHPSPTPFLRLPAKRRYFFSNIEPTLPDRLSHVTNHMAVIDPGVAVRVSISSRAIETFGTFSPGNDDLTHYTLLSRIERWVVEAEDALEAETRLGRLESRADFELLVRPLEKLAAECERRTAEHRKRRSESKQIVLDHISGPI